MQNRVHGFHHVGNKTPTIEYCQDSYKNKQRYLIRYQGEPVFRGIAELWNKRKSHSKYFFTVYSLYNVLIYIPHLDGTDPRGDL